MNSKTAPKSPTEYKPVQQGSNKNLMIILIVLFIFVAIFGSIGVFAYSVFKNIDFDSLSESETQNEQTYVTEFRGDIPSTCGYTIGRPTTITNTDTYYEWTYEEREVAPQNFRNLVPAWIANQGVMLTAMSYKTADDSWKVADQGDGIPTYMYNFPGLVSYCVNNASNWDLEAFTKNIEGISTDALTYELSGAQETWGELTLQPIQIEGILNGSYVNEPFYLGVTSEGTGFSRLVIFQPWGGQTDRLNTDIEAMKDSLKNREMSSKLSGAKNTPAPAPNNTTTTSEESSKPSEPNCTNFKIYEGEFKSDKCYDSETLRDLQHYISQYNSAIFTMNAAASSSRITCNGSDFFKDSCERDKDRYEDAKDDKEKYEDKIKGLIKKGK